MEPQWYNQELSTGTSIMAVQFQGGVVLGADSRTTTGVYIANRVTDKLCSISENIYCCQSGSAADTQAICNIVAYHLTFHQMELGEEPRVEVAAKIMQEICYDHRDSLLADIILCGWDKYKGGQVFSIPLGGMITRQPVAVGGSGSTYVYGNVDAGYQPDMTKDQCLKFVTETLTCAMARDGSSGGVIRLAVITKDGVERHCVLGDQLPRFFEG